MAASRTKNAQTVLNDSRTALFLSFDLFDEILQPEALGVAGNHLAAVFNERLENEMEPGIIGFAIELEKKLIVAKVAPLQRGHIAEGIDQSVLD
ncbi:MAG: hypothetical protein NTW86_15405 [Candidatus Sumerlaeota bacterium]|nr:hypothetical protein [Candidatus Sumerlaeota bacterium]